MPTSVAVVLTLMISSAVVLLPSSSRGGAVGEIQCGQVVESSLDPEDTDLGDGTWLESYRFTLDSLTTASVLMATDGFAPYVLITDDELVTQREGEPPLVVTLAPGSYQLFANNLDVLPAGDYPYALSLSCTTSEVEEIGCGQSVAGQLDPTDEGFILGTWIDTFEVSIDVPTSVRFQLATESFDPLVIVRNSDGSEVGSGSGEYSVDLPAGDYVVAANNFVPLPDSDAYPYILSMSCRSGACPGDCDGDGRVSIAELIRGVRIALGERDEACAAFDTDDSGQVAVNELVTAVRAALDGCAGV